MKPKPEFSKYQIKLIDMIIENNYSTKPWKQAPLRARESARGARA